MGICFSSQDVNERGKASCWRWPVSLERGSHWASLSHVPSGSLSPALASGSNGAPLPLKMQVELGRLGDAGTVTKQTQRRRVTAGPAAALTPPWLGVFQSCPPPLLETVAYSLGWSRGSVRNKVQGREVCVSFTW